MPNKIRNSPLAASLLRSSRNAIVLLGTGLHRNGMNSNFEDLRDFVIFTTLWMVAKERELIKLDIPSSWKELHSGLSVFDLAEIQRMDVSGFDQLETA